MKYLEYECLWKIGSVYVWRWWNLYFHLHFTHIPSLFTLDYSRFNMLLSDSWIKTLWKFSNEYNITILDRTTPYPLPQREGDVFLTEALENQGYSKKKLQILNSCRLYLQVMTLSDIMTGKGNSFTSLFQC